jgi:hypothetical protein
MACVCKARGPDVADEGSWLVLIGPIIGLTVV